MWRLGGLCLCNSARAVINPLAKTQTNHMFAAHLPYPTMSPIEDESISDISIQLLNQNHLFKENLPTTKIT